MHGNDRVGRGGKRLSSLIREIRARPQQNWVPQQNYSCSGKRSAEHRSASSQNLSEGRAFAHRSLAR
jgi:hypothetical protein